MRLVSKQKLYDFQQKHSDAKSHIETWVADVEEAKWEMPHDVRAEYPRVSLIGGQQAVFDIYGSNYRLWTMIDYVSQTVFVKEIGTHKEYEKWNIK